MNRYYLGIISLLTLLQCAPNKDVLNQALSKGSKGFKSTLYNPKHEIQIIYGEITEDSIVHHYFNHQQNKYFYPASTIKMPVAFAALKRAQELSISLDDPLMIDSTLIYPRKVQWDSTFNEPITIRNQVEKIFTVSDNSAHNILYGWLGKDYVNELYLDAGIETRITHQLGENAFSFKPSSNNYTRLTNFFRSPNDTFSFEEEKQAFQSQLIVRDQEKGIGYIDSLGNLINQSFDFSQKNFISLSHLLEILEAGVRPDLYQKNNPFNFGATYQKALISSMRLLPKDLAPYDTLKDNYVKFLGFGDETSGRIPDHVTIMNKVGWAYGYLLDVAYVEDSKNDLSFFLAAVIHVNNNEIYNDGVYEYEETGLPFLDELGDLIYQYELEKSAL